MREKVLEILREEFHNYDGDITEETDFLKDLEADSVDIVGFVMSLEEEFGLEFEDEDILNIRTVGDVIKALTERLNA